MFLADASGCHLVGDMMHTGVMSVRSWDRRRGSLEELEREFGGNMDEGKKLQEGGSEERCGRCLN